MPRNKRYQYEEDSQEEDLFISRSQKKRDSSVLQRVGAEIVLLPAFKLGLLPLSEDLKLAIAEHKKISHKEAKRRQLQYIGRLMREAQDEAALQGKDDIVTVYFELKERW